MSRTLAIIVASVLVASLTAATFALNNKNNTLQLTTDKQAKEIVVLVEKNEVKDDQIEQLEIKVEELEARIVVLNAEIKSLKSDLKAHTDMISMLNAKINRRNETINKLKNDITALARGKKDNSWKIKQLEKEKAKWQKSLEKHDASLADSEEAQAAKTKKIAAAKIKKMRMQRIANIVTHTEVVFEKVEARERKDSRAVKKIKNKKWRYTNLQFSLQHKNGVKDIMDEKFALIIRNLDTGKVLPYNEGNPKFIGKKVETGFPLTFNGNMFMVDYFNNEVKNGENFAAEIYYVLGNERFPIPAGSKQIIKNGKVVK